MLLKNIIKEKGINNREFVYRVVRENIMTLNLKPGECINEIDLVENFKVSRTPIREAFFSLSEEKLMDIFPQKGSFVSKIDISLVEEGAFLRSICEREMLKLACADLNSHELIKKLEKNLAYQKLVIEYEEDLHKFFDLDNEFHFIIFEHYNKANTWKNIKKLTTHYDRLRLIDTLEKMTPLHSLQQHQEIINIIKSKNISSIDSFIPNHLYQFKDIIQNYFDSFPDYFVK